MRFEFKQPYRRDLIEKITFFFSNLLYFLSNFNFKPLNYNNFSIFLPKIQKTQF